MQTKSKYCDGAQVESRKVSAGLNGPAFGSLPIDADPAADDLGQGLAEARPAAVNGPKLLRQLRIALPVEPGGDGVVIGVRLDHRDGKSLEGSEEVVEAEDLAALHDERHPFDPGDLQPQDGAGAW